MKKIYELLKGKELNYNNYKAVVVGYSPTRLILATTDEPMCAFKKLGKDFVVEDYYRTGDYKYVYADERNFSNEVKLR